MLREHIRQELYQYVRAVNVRHTGKRQAQMLELSVHHVGEYLFRCVRIAVASTQLTASLAFQMQLFNVGRKKEHAQWRALCSRDPLTLCFAPS
jgi:glucan biosynthesis protein